ncbi:L-aminoadipate-semialdehyde dehydrogenase-phosphopantetheinyl transferase [Frankliniella fusca]|uniref:L-aminoadipate-semialdehyde dehydrogenase-phosphopantetheinyl transferase n=1 Tax=Frankliniella fusca TaxID=407009 RepID=A0AAE1HS69_9NEOP|nr:L-aminoadipate-semialdehyde dehydrogenase-phosphopantetheinyl transferase [Frankliniella fusca]
MELLQGSVRWAFNTRTWNPSQEDWLLASRCIQAEDKERIQKFVFKADAKARMAGCLMIRKFVHLATGEPYAKIKIDRDEGGRPYATNPPLPVEFSISHEGHYTVLAGEINNCITVGVDIMSVKTTHELSKLFRLMNSSFTPEEWETIKTGDSEEEKSTMFFRHWCLKESYVKAIGVGICTDLQRISFLLKTKNLSIEKCCTDTKVQIDKVQNNSWSFQEWLLDSLHCVSVALSPCINVKSEEGATPFTRLSWSDLMKEADPFLPTDIDYCQKFMSKEERGDIHSM